MILGKPSFVKTYQKRKNILYTKLISFMKPYQFAFGQKSFFVSPPSTLTIWSLLMLSQTGEAEGL